MSECPDWIRRSFYRLLLNRCFVRFYDFFHSRKTLGAKGELAAERFLLKQGLVIIERGYHDKTGEIDLIASDKKKTVVFIEVKTRTTNDAHEPVEAVDEAKQMHITRTAKGYLKWHHLEDYPVRFDVVAVLWKSNSVEPEMRHYKNAFESTEQFQMF